MNIHAATSPRHSSGHRHTPSRRPGANAAPQNTSQPPLPPLGPGCSAHYRPRRLCPRSCPRLVFFVLVFAVIVIVFVLVHHHCISSSSQLDISSCGWRRNVWPVRLVTPLAPCANRSPKLPSTTPSLVKGLGECRQAALKRSSELVPLNDDSFRGVSERLQSKPRVVEPEGNLVSHPDAILSRLGVG